MSFITYGLQIYGKLTQVAATVATTVQTTMSQQSVLISFAHLNQHSDQ